MEVLRWVMLHGFPSSAIVQLHPVVLAVFDLAGVLQSLRKEFPKVIVIRRVFEAQIPDVTQILVEFLCHCVQY